jgi:hypothetical protein
VANDSSNDKDPRARLVDVLLTKVAEDPFPSSTMMDLLEEILTPDEAPAYAAVLLDKVRDDTFPSIPMIRRLSAFT